jgi:hypothetical protein
MLAWTWVATASAGISMVVGGQPLPVPFTLCTGYFPFEMPSREWMSTTVVISTHSTPGAGLAVTMPLPTGWTARETSSGLEWTAQDARTTLRVGVEPAAADFAAWADDAATARLAPEPGGRVEATEWSRTIGEDVAEVRWSTWLSPNAPPFQHHVDVWVQRPGAPYVVHCELTAPDRSRALVDDAARACGAIVVERPRP